MRESWAATIKERNSWVGKTKVKGYKLTKVNDYTTVPTELRDSKVDPIKIL